MSFKKTLALLLVIAMCFSFVPSFAFAQDEKVILNAVDAEDANTGGGYTVKIDANKGTLTGDAVLNVADGALMEEPSVSREGYQLTGWNAVYMIDGQPWYDAARFPAKITSDVTFQAMWTAIVTEDVQQQLQENNYAGEGGLKKSNDEFVTGGSAPVVAVIWRESKEVTYTSLESAFADAKNGEFINLQADHTLTEALNINLEDKAVIFDLNGHTLSGRVNLRSGDLRIQNGTVAGGNQQALNVYGSAGPAVDYSVLRIWSNLTVTGDVDAVCLFGNAYNTNGYGAGIIIDGTVSTTGNGSEAAVFVSGNLGNNVAGDANNYIIVNGSVTSTNDSAIALNGLATVSIYDPAVVTGNTAITVKRGTLNVAGGTITSTGAKNYPGTPNYNGSEMTGAGISVTDTYNKYGPLAVNISGGTIISNNADALYKKEATYQNSATVIANGGTFNTNPTAFVAEGYLAYPSGDNYVVAGEGAAIAKIGDVKYASLREAIASAADGALIELIKDDVVSFAHAGIEISGSKSLTIDGKDHTIYGVSNYDEDPVAQRGFLFTGSGNITIQNVKMTEFGDSYFVNKLSVPISTGAAFTGKLTLNNVTLDKFNRNAMNLQGGNFEITNCTITCNGKNWPGEQFDHFQQGIDIDNANGTIAGSTITGMSHATVSGEWDAFGICVRDNSTVTIENVTINSNDNGIELAGNGSVSISGTNTSITATKNPVIKTGTGTISITAGTFSKDPSNFVAQGHAVFPSGEVFIVAPVSDAEAQIGETYYLHLQDALDAGGNVTLLKTIAPTASLTVAADKTVTLDLNGKEINSTAGDAIVVDGKLTILDNGTNGAINQNNANSDDTIWVKAGGELVIESGTINSSGKYGVLYCSGNLTMTGGTVTATAATNAITLNGAATADISAGKVSGKWGIAVFGTSTLTVSGNAEIVGNGDSAISTNGSESGDNFSNSATINISGGTIHSNDIAAYAPAATWNISGGIFTGTTAVYAKGGKLTITDGTFNGTGDAVAFAHGSSGATATGDAVVIESSNYPYSPVTVSITGGTFTSASAKAVAAYAATGYEVATKFITGGTYNTEPVASYIADGYDVTKDSGVYTVAAHVHNFDYEHPTWEWKIMNGTWYATATYACACGATDSETVKAVRSETGSEIKYTATDSHNNSDFRTTTKTYVVTYEGDDKQGGTFEYGATCKLTASVPSNWTVDNVVRAKNATTFYFPVTESVTVSSVASTGQEDVTVLEVLSAVGGTNQLTYHVTWSVPEGAQVTSTKIFRYKAADGNTVDAETLLAQTNLRTWDMKLNVRNGDYTYTAGNLTSDTHQNIMFQIVYTLNGQTATCNSKVTSISIK